MDIQRFSIRERVLSVDHPLLQDALAQVHNTPERPRCLCVAGGIEIYVSRLPHFVVKRMPAGHRHHPGCPSYEPDPALSGLGELVVTRFASPTSAPSNCPWTSHGRDRLVTVDHARASTCPALWRWHDIASACVV